MVVGQPLDTGRLGVGLGARFRVMGPLVMVSLRAFSFLLGKGLPLCLLCHAAHYPHPH